MPKNTANAPAKAKVVRGNKGSGGRRPSPSVDPATLPDMYFNREASWLDFNARVLALAATASIPLLERIKFLSIFSTNLDEFYMVRVAGLMEQVRMRSRSTGADGLTADNSINAISRRVREMAAAQAKLWLKELLPQLKKNGIEIASRSELTEAEIKYLRKYFTRQIYPVLTPMGVDPAHPFPHLPNKSLSLCVMLRPKGAGSNGGSRKTVYAFVEVPQLLSRFVPLKVRGKSRFILISEVIAMHLQQLFAGSQVVDSFELRVTRDSDLEIDEEDAEDLLKVVEAELRQRQWGNVVRLEISSRAPDEAVAFLREMLEIERRDIIPVEGPLNFGDWISLARLPGRDDLRYKPFKPHVRAGWRQEGNIFDHLRAGDILVHHPYESFNSVADFIDTASTDPGVLAIKMTLYRTSPESPIMRSLIKAANNGKQVVALVELKARFDEANNILWARLLEREGVHVVYGIVGYKTHCKACLVVRREGKQLRRYCHLATGNYNPTTAAIYTDFGLFTADPNMCEDVSNLFNTLTGFANHTEWNNLVLAPNDMHSKLLKLIHDEIHLAHRGGKAHIICKMNSLVEPKIIAALYEASRAGVKIDLIVRGNCCLRPGVPGVSENIRVISIVGRFLEHSRIFYFNQSGQPLVYLSSADWMQRNFFNRIETMFPVEDPQLRERIVNEILASALNDNVNAWELRSDGTWKRRSPPSPSAVFDSHAHLIGLEDKLAAKKED
ncbi:MAG: polyphosphate kinase 1 [Candidatus Sumerlaeota bacterium]|nr:polyphosphate kinase 1 [Candidatus Sumerlaeota bacterium]